MDTYVYRSRSIEGYLKRKWSLSESHDHTDQLSNQTKSCAMNNSINTKAETRLTLTTVPAPAYHVWSRHQYRLSRCNPITNRKGLIMRLNFGWKLTDLYGTHQRQQSEPCSQVLPTARQSLLKTDGVALTYIDAVKAAKNGEKEKRIGRDMRSDWGLSNDWESKTACFYVLKTWIKDRVIVLVRRSVTGIYG